MLTVTDAAAAHISDLLDKHEAPEQAAVRLVPSEQGLQLSLAEPSDEDRSLQHDGKTVLLVPPQVDQLLNEQTLDVEDTESGSALVIRGSEDAAPDQPAG